MSASAGFSFTDKTNDALTTAIGLARERSHVHVQPIHIALALLDPTVIGTNGGTGSAGGDCLFANVLDKAGADAREITRALNKRLVREPSQDPPPDQVGFSSSSTKVLKEAQKLMRQQNDGYIAQDHLILALLDDSVIKQIFKEANVSDQGIRTAISAVRAGRKVDSKSAEEGFDALRKYAIDLTEKARENLLDPVIGRDNEVRRCIRILCRRTKNNPVLIGEPGVGKTAIAEGLAQRMVNRDVPASLIGRLFALDLGAIQAGASYKGQFEERIKSILNEVEKATEKGENIILFIDEMHLIMAGQGASSGGMDAANLIKPVLARGKLRCLGATTLAEYRKYIEKDAAFERRFQQVIVNEPSVPETISILRGLKEKYETHHGVTILDNAIVTAATLAHRYLTARRLPDSAIDLVDEAAAAVRVTRDSQPEAVDRLERKKLQIEVEAHALAKEKDDESKTRLEAVNQEIAAINDELQPLKAAWEAAKSRGDKIRAVREKIDSLKAKAEDAERRYDVSTAADLRHYAIPDLEEQLSLLEAHKRTEDAKRGPSELEDDVVTSDGISEIVARWTGVPVSRLKATEKVKLRMMEKALMKQVVGQPEAVKAVADSIRLSRSGLSNESRPIASFLFCGPSGTGKTLLTKALAKFLFDSEEAICRIDGSEYSEKHSISRLIGSPPGYVGHEEGGTLTEWVRRKPYSIVLIDEIEKASREFSQLFLQVLDDGRLTDSQGRVISFRNCVIVMTSNLGAAFLNELEDDSHIPDSTRSLVHGAIRSHFAPEFINRIDATIIFNKLGTAQIRSIVDVRLAEIQKRLHINGKNIQLEIDDQARNWLGQAGFNPQYGARPLNRTIQNELLHPLSRMILDERIRDGEAARITADWKLNRLVIFPNHEALAMDIDEEQDVLSDDEIKIEDVN
ncbi:hypothetical protein PTTG_00828 [Puccinia triticina 1-1 BBBD Race 1]|uniref:Clp R domain-containing protein n=2 Tax=Puccinia triticina TaxID=208348 RepID=A0A180GM14_PUCT1|nr:uncharacterized protein PtA15_3A580 [Puccinia triticina]OAV93508.1 hypothetical protein PTTG_00828 [Puccinia triticina 1-1 BBBD Race 1]WAQ83211.1 hypothetical protein PtA15_3A580 [Puccinia triticina]WAR54058.1 hypothetical protein PtB15_3B568 [Puccinia triticina]